MILRKLTLAEFQCVYEERMREDFCADELKPFAQMAQLFEAGRYFCLGAFEKEALLAYTCFIVSPMSKALLFDYFAVTASGRGRGIGSEVLRLLPTVCGDYAWLYGEVEDPDFAEDEAETILRKRRIAFYDRAGYRHMPLKTRIYGVHFLILAYPLQQEPELGTVRSDLKATYAELYQGLHAEVLDA